MVHSTADFALVSEDLDPASRRRLWLLSNLIGSSGIEDISSAIAKVKILDEFVKTGNGGSSETIYPLKSNAGSGVRADALERPRAENDDPPAVSAPSASDGSPAEASFVAFGRSLDRGGEDRPPRRCPNGAFLDPETRRRFQVEAAKNPDNRHLAGLFGITVRQAHAIRIGLRRGSGGPAAGAALARAAFAPRRHGDDDGSDPERNVARVQAGIPAQARTRTNGSGGERRPPAPIRSGPPGRVARPGRAKPAELDRPTELRMQEEFLASRPARLPTVEDVIRFLRQQGDVVLTEGRGYRVNFANVLTADELIARANAKRTERGLEPFHIADEIRTVFGGS